MIATAKRVHRIPRVALTYAIEAYQKTLSPDHGFLSAFFPNGYCRYYPTCSEYGKRAIMKYGVLCGAPRAVWRVLRCNPWSKGGVDEV